MSSPATNQQRKYIPYYIATGIFGLFLSSCCLIFAFMTLSRQGEAGFVALGVTASTLAFLVALLGFGAAWWSRGRAGVVDDLLEGRNLLAYWDYKIDETEVPWLIAEKLAERGFDNLLRHFKEYKDPETGKAPENEKEFALYALKYATQKLWDPAQHEGGDKINGWEEFVKVGVWNSDPYPYRKRWGKMGTKTGMFEFFSETLKQPTSAAA